MLTTTVCAALSAAGLALAFLTAYRRRFIAATRVAALALVPVGLALAGLTGLAVKIITALGAWAGDLVLRPTVWAGFVVLAVAFALYVIARVAARRRPPRPASGGADGERPAASATDAPAPALGASTPGTSGVPAVRPSARDQRAQGKPSAGGGADDFSDVEEILRKHGI